MTDGTATLHNSVLDTTSPTVSGTTDYFTRDDRGLLLADRGSSSTKYYLLDPLGSVLATTNSPGAVSASYAYDPYGNSIGTAPSPFGYARGYRTNTGLYHFGARYHDPGAGRWTQEDPLSDFADLTEANRFAYASGDPISSSDPSGLIGKGVGCARKRRKCTTPPTGTNSLKILGKIFEYGVTCVSGAAKTSEYGVYFGVGEGAAAAGGCALAVGSSATIDYDVTGDL